MIDLKEFNKIYVESECKRLENIKAYYIKPFKLYTEKKQEITKELKNDSNGIPYYERTIKIYDKPKLKFNVNQFNALIVAYLKLFTNPIKANITHTKGNYISGVGFIANRDKGRADVTAQYQDFELCIETKQKYEKQLNSQKSFEKMTQQQSFRKYVLVRNFEEFQIEMKKIFEKLP